MAIKRLNPEEIVVELREVEVFIGQGTPRIDAIRQISVAEQILLPLEEEIRRNGHGTAQVTEAPAERERASAARGF